LLPRKPIHDTCFLCQGESGVVYIDSSDDEDDQDLLNIKVAGSAYSTFGVTEVLACKPILQDGLQSTNNVRSLEVKDISEVLTKRAGTSILRPPSENDQDLLSINVAGSSYSASEVAEVLTDQACKPILQKGLESILQPPSEDDQDLLNMKVTGSLSSAFGVTEVLTNNARSPEVKGISEVVTERAGTSILQLPSDDDQDLLNMKVAGSLCSAFGISDVSEVLKVDVCESMMQPEVHKRTLHVRSSPDRRSPYFPSSGKKRTFSLQSFDKYIMGSV
jgi:hypothetical protein